MPIAIATKSSELESRFLDGLAPLDPRIPDGFRCPSLQSAAGALPTQPYRFYRFTNIYPRANSNFRGKSAYGPKSRGADGQADA